MGCASETGVWVIHHWTKELFKDTCKEWQSELIHETLNRIQCQKKPPKKNVTTTQSPLKAKSDTVKF